MGTREGFSVWNLVWDIWSFKGKVRNPILRCAIRTWLTYFFKRESISYVHSETNFYVKRFPLCWVLNFFTSDAISFDLTNYAMPLPWVFNSHSCWNSNYVFHSCSRFPSLPFLFQLPLPIHFLFSYPSPLPSKFKLPFLFFVPVLVSVSIRCPIHVPISFRITFHIWISISFTVSVLTA